MNLEPTLSVVMLVHNGGRFLRPAVDSVLASTVREIEVVLFDNGSTDGALDSLPHDSRLKRVGSLSNLGIPAGLNIAVSHARAPFVAIVDQDDRVRPERFKRQVAWLIDHPDFAGVASRTVLIDAHDRRLGGDFTLHRADEHRAFTAFSQAACFGSHLWRRDVLETFPRRPAFPFSSDFDFVARVNDRHSVAALPEELFDYRIHPSQTTAQRRREQVAAECAIRLLTARRRRAGGEAETWPKATEWLAQAMQLPDVASVYRACLAACRRFSEPELAVYHARRLLGRSRHLRDLHAAASTAAWALRAERSDRSRLVRLFFRGPLRTLGLHPWR